MGFVLLSSAFYVLVSVLSGVNAIDFKQYIRALTQLLAQSIKNILEDKIYTQVKKLTIPLTCMCVHAHTNTFHIHSNILNLTRSDYSNF